MEQPIKSLLNALRQVPPYKVVHKETRKVSRDCYISFLGNKYSVPYRFAGRTAELQIFEGKFEVYVDYEKICEHEILPGNCRVSRKKEHFQGLLSEILKENSKCKKASQIPLKFSGPEVEKRSLDVYETMKSAGFPVKKTLEEFDFEFQKSIDKKVMEDLATLRFVHNSENVVLLGPPGVGKSHLAIALGMQF
ncbi:Mobile element protein [Methanosarcina mazei Tuc01]|uniref:Mobile element protein n=1 Tax=Methanosarcina mazei Tuc01 TaxID=1236903 RepID=M1Q0D5_METMZ|nr:Mobile element protein [Methanosarcina mazei Tuc01]